MDRRILFGTVAVVVAAAGLYLVSRPTLHRVATQAVNTGITQLIAELPPGTSIEHGAVELNPLTRVVTLHDVVLKASNGDVWNADIVTVADVDGPGLRDVFDPASYPNGHPAWTKPRLLVGDFTAHGVRMTAPDGTLKIDSVILHDLRARPFALPPTAANRALPAFRTDAITAMQLANFKLTNAMLHFTTPQPGTLTFAGFSISGYDSDHIASIALEDLAIDGTSGPARASFHAGVQRIDIRNGGLSYLTLLASGGPDKASMQAAMYNPLNSGADVEGISFSQADGPVVTMKSTHMENAGATSGGVKSSTANLQNLMIGLGHMPVSPAASAAIAAFGMDKLTMDIESNGKVSLPAKTMDVREDILFEGLGTLHLKAAISGYEPLNYTPAKPLEMWRSASITHAALVWDDASLTSRAVAVAAEKAHTTPDMIKAKLAIPLMSLGVMLPEQPDAGAQISAFLDHPHQLSITLDPPLPITIGAIAATPSTRWAPLLGLHITGD